MKSSRGTFSNAARTAAVRTSPSATRRSIRRRFSRARSRPTGENRPPPVFNLAQRQCERVARFPRVSMEGTASQRSMNYPERLKYPWLLGRPHLAPEGRGSSEKTGQPRPGKRETQRTGKDGKRRGDRSP